MSIQIAPSSSSAARASSSEISDLVRCNSSRYVVMSVETVAAPRFIPAFPLRWPRVACRPRARRRRARRGRRSGGRRRGRLGDASGPGTAVRPIVQPPPAVLRPGRGVQARGGDPARVLAARAVDGDRHGAARAARAGAMPPSSSTMGSPSTARGTSTRPPRRSPRRSRPAATPSTRSGPTRSCTPSSSRRGIRSSRPRVPSTRSSSGGSTRRRRATSRRPSTSTRGRRDCSRPTIRRRLRPRSARFDESDLSASFSRLGPLVKRFPRSVSVRYHLGLLLAWTGQRDQAIVEFREAKRLGPHSELGREANAFVVRLVTDRTNRTSR